MGAGPRAQLGPLVGRAAEEQILAGMLQGAAAGQPSAVFVHGEAGVGKTSLVRDACGRFKGELLWGTCVHFGAASVPFAAVTSALDGWVAAAGEPARDEVLAGLDALRVLLPGMSAGGAGELGLMLPQLDTALVRIARRRPAVLVIDDLQWADPSSLDLLAFLVSEPVVNEHHVRAPAGTTTMVLGAVAFSLAYFESQYVGLQVVASFFFVECLHRVTAGISRSPVGILAAWVTRRQPSDGVSARPKRFAGHSA